MWMVLLSTKIIMKNLASESEAQPAQRESEFTYKEPKRYLYRKTSGGKSR